MLQLGELLLSLSRETHGAVDKQPAELSRSPVAFLCPDVGGGALETLPHDIFPEIRVCWGWQAGRLAGKWSRQEQSQLGLHPPAG